MHDVALEFIGWVFGLVAEFAADLLYRVLASGLASGLGSLWADVADLADRVGREADLLRVGPVPAPIPVRAHVRR